MDTAWGKVGRMSILYGNQIRGPSTLVIVLSIVFILLTSVAGHFFSSKKMPKPVRTIALWVAAGASTAVAFFFNVASGGAVSEDFPSPGVPCREALIVTDLVWAHLPPGRWSTVGPGMATEAVQVINCCNAEPLGHVADSNV